MKNTIRIYTYAISFSGILFLLTNSCDKAEIPVLTTIGITNITISSATCWGNINSDGGSEIISRGVTWDTVTNSKAGNSKLEGETDIGGFSCSITGLNANTRYYVRAFAINRIGMAYGNELTFTTLK